MGRVAPNPKVSLDLKLVHEVIRDSRTDQGQAQKPANESEITPQI